MSRSVPVGCFVRRRRRARFDSARRRRRRVVAVVVARAVAVVVARAVVDRAARWRADAAPTRELGAYRANSEEGVWFGHSVRVTPRDECRPLAKSEG
jgi:type IV secretory pathway protease TraF